MKIRIRDELLPLNLLVLLLIAAIIFFPSSVVRIIVGLPFVLFFPGYALMTALFPRRNGVSNTGRLALSFGMSIIIVPLLGLILNYSRWGIRLESVVYFTAAFILIASVITWLRRRRLSRDECFTIEFRRKIPGSKISIADKALYIILGLAVLAGLGAFGYAIGTPKVGERVTEFYLVGLDDNDRSYPSKLTVGEEAKIVIAIINNEYEIVNYRVEVRIDGVKSNEVEGITLRHQEKWENEVSFVPKVTGKDQKLEFLLYKNGEAASSLKPLRLWLDVGGE